MAEDKKEEITKETQLDLAKENETLRLELGELKETLQRLQAEFENYRKRCERESASNKETANEDLVESLLPTIDNFELALASKSSRDDLHKGMELIYAQLYQLLEDKGLEKIDCLEKKFDPYYHEALLTEESDKEPNTILEELQKGYLLNNKVLRHSKVKISKKTGGK